MGAVVVRGAHTAATLPGPRSIALGSFDGLHSGHRTLLKAVADDAKRRKGIALLVSFYPHPTIVLGRSTERPPLLSLRQRLAILSDLGFHALVMIRFTKSLSRLSAEEFIDRILVEQLDAQVLFVGPDAAFGKGRAAGVTELATLFSQRGRELVVVPHVNDGEHKIGSRLIRGQIVSGDVTEASRFLEIPYTLEGRVLHGDGRGKTISFPTANLSTKQLLPAAGVYSGYMRLGGRELPAVINIGIRPTFNGSRTTVEAHLYNYSGKDFYGEHVALSFVSRLRAERRFENIEALVAQIKLDVVEAKKILESANG